jgi:hypothetical protein
MLPDFPTSIYILRHQDMLDNLNSYGAYPTVAIAEAWMGFHIHELLKERLLDTATEGTIGEINRLLATGQFSEASEVFNDLQYALKMRKVWIEGVDFKPELPIFTRGAPIIDESSLPL